MLSMIIKKSRPNLSEVSINQYLSSLRTLNGGQPINDLNFLNDFDGVMLSLKKKKPTTVKNYANAAIVALTSVAADPALVKKYADVRDALNTQYSEFHATHEKTPKQEANWVEFGEYRSMVDGLREEVAGVLKEKEWSVQTRRKYQEYLLPLIFTVLPLRNEFVMTVVSKSAFNRLTPAEKEKGNYFVAPQKGPMFLVINQYKTSKRYGEKIIELEDPELVASLKVWLKHRPADTTSLFFEPVGMVEPATSGSITKVMTAVSKRELGGKSIGSSLLRHIFLSAKYADTLKEMEADAEVMGHSVETAQKIYVKN